ncbi:hypothetical protein KAFR_0A03660 [Kazachstania africana CBS 2517]|uniref:Peptidase M20 dimerisation domain-containing protein n=1 Tax=Kazachstania africana (strain ATCC 22294 / BCRC 22015 / CBS 2517 / CECT 1963 / NBRC 1671 / NRRL Y-8276) TaxID=1071382 RepID=H2AN51_KAZAF|nr:hypothetical protein KAFR_0A03660 [Kazachstania africana CBS 2517]CCF55801.1 hypothetical protein KAFR_0A03660 [Kazachstania africana CBS 2517]
MSGKPDLIHRWNHTYSILSICSFPKKKLLFAGTQDSKILVFDLPGYSLIDTITIGEPNEAINTRSSVLCLDKSIDEKYLFSAGTDSLIRIWSINYDVGHLRINEIATVYSVTDIGDIFSISYLDSIQTLVFGCLNASLLYLDNILQKLETYSNNFECHMNRLPHRRYDKFFDSFGPTGCATPSSQESLDTLANKKENIMILEIPSENIVKYAHNGFIYSICKIPNTFKGIFNEDCSERIISGGGDGVSKIWSFTKNNETGSVSISSDFEELDNEESVLSQSVEFPFLYCGLSDGAVNIWDLSTQQLVTTLHTPDKHDIIALSVYKDHIFAINASGVTLFHQDLVNHWNPNQGKMLSCEVLERISESGDRIFSLLTGGNDGSLTLWDIQNSLKTESLQKRQSVSWTTYKKAPTLDFEDMMSSMKKLISFVTVSQSSETSHKLALRRCATFLQQLFLKLGASASQLLPVAGGHNPVIFAVFKGTGSASHKKSILWYGHYDVISAGERDRWNTDPFVLTNENGYMKGRGVTDNKGPLISAIYSVAMLQQEGNLYNDVTFLIEGDEEIGSPGLSNVCEQFKSLIGDNMDWILLSNSTWVDREHPCLNYGLRGVINAEINVFSDEKDLHSGVNGGISREPTFELVNIISKLQDEKGQIKIPNFYSELKELSEEELNRFKIVTEVANIEKHRTVEELTANWARPSLSITTLRNSGPGNITVIPRSSSMGISIRLVPGQSVERVKKDLFDYVNDCFAKLSSKNHLSIKILNDAEPWLGDPTNHAYQVVREELVAAWETEPLFVREGGSIPCIRALERIFNAKAIQIPCGQSTDNAHLDNENLSIKNWTKLAQILSNVFNRL